MQISRITCAIVTLFLLLLPLPARKLNPSATPARSDKAPSGGVPAQGFREEDKPLERALWFYEQRLYPLKQLPRGVYSRAVRQAREMRRVGGAQSPAAALSVATVGPWVSIGPRPSRAQGKGDSGRVSAMAVDPRDPNVVYLGGAQGGIWKTTDGGINWTPLTDDQVTLAIGSIALAPSNPDTVYVGTGEQVFTSHSYYGAGLLKSTDGGTTWQHLPGTFAGPFGSGKLEGGASIGSLAVHPTNPDIVLAGVFDPTSETNSGVMRSTDGGTTWSFVTLAGGGTLTGAAGTEVVFATGDGSVAYGALGAPFRGGDADNGFYKSTDGGVTWMRMPGTGANVLPTVDVGRIEFAAAPSDPNTVYVGIQNAGDLLSFGTLLGFFKSTDGGQNWTQLTNTHDYCQRQCAYDHVIRVHPTDPNIVFAGGAATSLNGEPGFVLRTLDGGLTWEGVARTTETSIIHPDIHALEFSSPATPPLKLYVGTDGGPYSTNDITAPVGTINWANLNDTLTLAQFYPSLDIHPSNPDHGMGGTQDNGSLVYSGSPVWALVTCGDGARMLFDPLIPTTVYTICQDLTIRRSFDGWQIVQAVMNGINREDRRLFIAPLTHDLSLSQRLYFGTFRVYQTSSGGDRWDAISPDLTSGTGRLSAIAVAPSDSNVVYAGSTEGKIQRTVNAEAGTAATWSDLTTVDLPPRFVTQVTVDPLQPDTAYATFSGFSGFAPGDNKGHVFRTINGGITWTDISGNLPNTPANDLVVDPDVTGTLYLATDVGVFATTDLGTTWAALGTGLPRVAVTSLRLHRNSRILRAGTLGRGAWDLQLDNFGPSFNVSSISPVSATAGSADITLTVGGHGFDPTSQVQWDGTTLAGTAFIDAQQLEVTVPAALLSAPRMAQVTVEQTPGGTVSNQLGFSVLGAAHPFLAELSPASAPLGSPGLTLTVTGTGFDPSTVVRWNGDERPTTFLDAATLTAQIPASDLTTRAQVEVRAFTPLPGGGASDPLIFVVGAETLPNDDFVNAIAVSGTTFTDTQDTLIATTEVPDPLPSCVQGLPFLADGGRAKSIWYQYTPAADQVISVDTQGSAYDTILSAYTGSQGNLQEIGCNDDIQPGVIRTSQILNLSVTGGQTVSFMISAYIGDGGTTIFNFNLGSGGGQPFTVNASPTSLTVTAGQSASTTLTVTPQPGGFNNVVSFSCSGLPAQSRCTFSPTSVTPGSSPANVTLTISTTARGTVVPTDPQAPFPPMLLLLVSASLTLWLILAAAGRRYRTAMVVLALVLFLALFQVACGGGGQTPTPTPTPGTPAGTFNITVTATDGQSPQTTALTLTVN